MTQDQKDSVNELRELARAIQAFIDQDSRSFRRQTEIRNGASWALSNAQDAFGDET